MEGHVLSHTKFTCEEFQQLMIPQSNVLCAIGFLFLGLVAQETIWNMFCLMLENYPLTNHDHITRKMKILGNLVMISTMKGISNFGHTIFKHVQKRK